MPPPFERLLVTNEDTLLGLKTIFFYCVQWKGSSREIKKGCACEAVSLEGAKSAQVVDPRGSTGEAQVGGGKGVQKVVKE